MNKKSNALLWGFFFATALFGFLAGLFINLRAALLAAACVFFCALATAASYRKNRKVLSELAFDMDRLLHGDYRVRFQKYEEGETAVVANELAKITDTLQSQAEKLKKEKVYLADSIADISHQIRTPLTALNLTLETFPVMADAANTNPAIAREQAEKQKQLKGLTRRMEWLIEALLKLSKLDAGTVHFVKEPVCAAELVKHAVQPFGILMEVRGQTLDLSGLSGEAHFLGDMAWSAEAVGNVLKNCIEHTGEGGTIWVSASENAIYTEIIIEDDGEGLDENDLLHLFERFYKGKNSSGNSVGIGLALTRAILSAQNGTICAENRRTGGARFLLRIYKGIV
ncbi:MAG: HAMP domain-containing histidine kinase [Lachnospiraceae bacterium]|nr:HAMP domain-containing histidine kinase [Lachnospiraceae bacterium]